MRSPYGPPARLCAGRGAPRAMKVRGLHVPHRSTRATASRSPIREAPSRSIRCLSCGLRPVALNAKRLEVVVGVGAAGPNWRAVIDFRGQHEPASSSAQHAHTAVPGQDAPPDDAPRATDGRALVPVHRASAGKAGRLLFADTRLETGKFGASHYCPAFFAASILCTTDNGARPGAYWLPGLVASAASSSFCSFLPGATLVPTRGCL